MINAIKALLQMQNGFLQLESTLTEYINFAGYMPNLTSVKHNLKIYDEQIFYLIN
jgi:hypothetical protein